MTTPLQSGYRVTIQPARRRFGGRNQWKFDIRRIENGQPFDPRDTYANQADLIDQIKKVLGAPIDMGDGLTLISVPVELVVLNRHGDIESRRRLR